MTMDRWPIRLGIKWILVGLSVIFVHAAVSAFWSFEAATGGILAIIAAEVWLLRQRRGERDG